MTGQLNDLWVSYLQGEGYTGKQYNDLLRQALQDNTGTSRKQLNDLWATYLKGEGYAGSINDMMYKWLGDKGYEGSLNDRLYQALIASDVFSQASPSDLFTGSDFGDWFLFSDTSLMYQDTAATTPVSVSGDPVGLVIGKRGVISLKQATTSLKPIFVGDGISNTTNNNTRLVSDLISPTVSALTSSCFSYHWNQDSLGVNSTAYLIDGALAPDDGDSGYNSSLGQRKRLNYLTDVSERGLGNDYYRGGSVARPGTGLGLGWNTTAQTPSAVYKNAVNLGAPTAGTDTEHDRLRVWEHSASANNASKHRLFFYIDRQLTSEEITFLHDYAGAL